MLFSLPILKENPLHPSFHSHAEWFSIKNMSTAGLMWSTQQNQTGILYRQFYKNSSTNTLLKLYTSFIRPHLEYACTAWDPFLKKDITLLEDIQNLLRKSAQRFGIMTMTLRCCQNHVYPPWHVEDGRQSCVEESYFPDPPLVSREHWHNAR